MHLDLTGEPQTSKKAFISSLNKTTEMTSATQTVGATWAFPADLDNLTASTPTTVRMSDSRVTKDSRKRGRGISPTARTDQYNKRMRTSNESISKGVDTYGRSTGHGAARVAPVVYSDGGDSDDDLVITDVRPAPNATAASALTSAPVWKTRPPSYARDGGTARLRPEASNYNRPPPSHIRGRPLIRPNEGNTLPKEHYAATPPVASSSPSLTARQEMPKPRGPFMSEDSSSGDEERNSTPLLSHDTQAGAARSSRISSIQEDEREKAEFKRKQQLLTSKRLREEAHKKKSQQMGPSVPKNNSNSGKEEPGHAGGRASERLQPTPSKNSDDVIDLTLDDDDGKQEDLGFAETVTTTRVAIRDTPAKVSTPHRGKADQSARSVFKIESTAGFRQPVVPGAHSADVKPSIAAMQAMVEKAQLDNTKQSEGKRPVLPSQSNPSLPVTATKRVHPPNQAQEPQKQQKPQPSAKAPFVSLLQQLKLMQAEQKGKQSDKNDMNRVPAKNTAPHPQASGVSRATAVESSPMVERTANRLEKAASSSMPEVPQPASKTDSAPGSRPDTQASLKLPEVPQPVSKTGSETGSTPGSKPTLALPQKPVVPAQPVAVDAAEVLRETQKRRIMEKQDRNERNRYPADDKQKSAEQQRPQVAKVPEVKKVPLPAPKVKPASPFLPDKAREIRAQQDKARQVLHEQNRHASHGDQTGISEPDAVRQPPSGGTTGRSGDDRPPGPVSLNSAACINAMKQAQARPKEPTQSTYRLQSPDLGPVSLNSTATINTTEQPQARPAEFNQSTYRPQSPNLDDVAPPNRSYNPPLPNTPYRQHPPSTPPVHRAPNFSRSSNVFSSKRSRTRGRWVDRPTNVTKELGEVTAEDVQLVQWKHQGLTWQDIIESYTELTQHKRGEETLRRRYRQVEEVLNDDKITPELCQQVLDHVAGAQEELNRLIESAQDDEKPAGLFGERTPKFAKQPAPKQPAPRAPRQHPDPASNWVQNNPKRSAQYRPVSPDLTPPESQSSTTEVLHDDPTSTERPTVAGKQPCWAMIIGDGADVSDDESDDELDDREKSPMTDEDYCHFAYQIEWRCLTAEKHEEEGTLIEDVPWVSVGDAVDKLPEANASASEFVFSTPPDHPQIIDPRSPYTISSAPGENGEAFCEVKTHIGVAQARVRRFRRDFRDHILPQSKEGWLPKTLFYAKKRVTLETKGDDLFEASTRSVVEEIVGQVASASLEMANMDAVGEWVVSAWRPSSMRIDLVTVERNDEKTRLLQSLEEKGEDARFNMSIENEGKKVEIWVDELKVQGPRN